MDPGTFWPDTLEVSAYLARHQGRHAWAVIAGHDVLAYGACGDHETAVDAQLAVFNSLLTHSRLAGMPVDLAPNDWKLRGTLEDSPSLFPNIGPLPACRVSVHHDGLAYAAQVATDTAAQAGQAGPVLIVAATGVDIVGFNPYVRCGVRYAYSGVRRDDFVSRARVPVVGQGTRFGAVIGRPRSPHQRAALDKGPTRSHAERRP